MKANNQGIAAPAFLVLRFRIAPPFVWGGKLPLSGAATISRRNQHAQSICAKVLVSGCAGLNINIARISTKMWKNSPI
jgi:hypothetical protein